MVYVSWIHLSNLGSSWVDEYLFYNLWS